MSNQFKLAKLLVKVHSAKALMQSGNDTEQALNLLKTWGEGDITLAAALALVGCQMGINEACQSVMEP